ncbi:hypothetical protein [uncultured Shimia sp.]|uniref:hypothetical protein n=1 Tax=uncultured Shimia sp. TaxID=573152 RepID=UPI0026307A4F|nr:hypothetical protein [uncultured Shimia sp.]
MQTLFLSMAVLTGGWAPATGQPAIAQDRSAEAFASENAILDTAIPFAIGAREARQALRGAFGWPSFQEGLVEGVYFRFDPDGYARFAPTPRLDVDVFEVICRPRTYACAARKDGLEVFLTDRGQLQMRLENALAGDMFFVSEGVSEIQVPERILQPLDVQLELLLGAGGELSTRRGGTEVSRVSLKGFSAVTAYLRWIAARQDYVVLPRGWPVPNAETAGGMTKPAAWNSPMPQPQVVAPGYGASMTSGIAPPTSAAPLTYPGQAPQAGLVPGGAMPSVQVQPLAIQPVLSAYGAAPSDVLDAETLRRELSGLKDLIVEAQGNGTGASPAPTAWRTADGAFAEPPTSMDLALLLETLERLQAQVAHLQSEGGAGFEPAVETALDPQGSQGYVAGGRLDGARLSAQDQTGERLAYLVKQLGFDAQTAVAILQASPDAAPGVQQSGAVLGGALVSEISMQQPGVLYENAMVDQILAELEAEMVSAEAQAPRQEVSREEYQLLSRYFVSVGLPTLLPESQPRHAQQP